MARARGVPGGGGGAVLGSSLNRLGASYIMESAHTRKPHLPTLKDHSTINALYGSTMLICTGLYDAAARIISVETHRSTSESSQKDSLEIHTC